MEKSVEYNEEFMKDALENYKSRLHTFDTDFELKTKFDKFERDYSFQCNGHLWAGDGSKTYCYGGIGYKRLTETGFDIKLLDKLGEQDLIDVAKDNKLIVPFIVGTGIEIKGKTEKYKIKNIRYEFDKETGLMGVTFNCVTKEDLQKLKFEDYGVTWTVDTKKLGKETSKLIKFTDECVVKPIVVGDFAVDGSFVYRNKGSKTDIVGYWKGSKIHLGITSKNSDLDMIVNNAIVLDKYRRLIAPYKIYEENKVK